MSNYPRRPPGSLFVLRLHSRPAACVIRHVSRFAQLVSLLAFPVVAWGAGVTELLMVAQYFAGGAVFPLRWGM